MNELSHCLPALSTNGGTTWRERARVSTVSTNDQWMPMMAVKPDGTQLLIAWYDRRHDTNNSLIDVYGRFASIATNGTVSFTNEFRITTTSFLPVFAGSRGETEPIYNQPGHFDPVYPQQGVNLHFWYPEWPDDPTEVTLPAYEGHVGEYNGAWASGPSVNVAWTDSRLTSAGNLSHRPQTDIRTVRLNWP